MAISTSLWIEALDVQRIEVVNAVGDSVNADEAKEANSEILLSILK